MAEERERHDQRHPPDAWSSMSAEQLGAALAVERVLEVAEHVLQHIRLPARRGDDARAPP